MSAQDFRERLAPVVEAGGSALAVHLRAREVSASRLFQVALWLTTAYNTPLVVVNDRLDVALAAGAGGVHLREDSIPVEAVRRIAGPGLFVGRSIHEPEQAAGLWRGVADYLVLGAIFATKSHPGRPSLGPRALAAALERTDIPIFAIGGITPETVPPLVSLGARGVVVASGVWDSGNPGAAVIRYLESLPATEPLPTRPGLREQAPPYNQAPRHDGDGAPDIRGRRCRVSGKRAKDARG